LKANEKGLIDPWKVLFDRAYGERNEDANDLVPFWIYDVEKGYKIERRIPVLPLSKELSQLGWLKKTLVAYRSVMGQPRQEDLLEFIAQSLNDEELRKFVENSRIDLSPPGSLGRFSAE
jgi:hypothetical protein